VQVSADPQTFLRAALRSIFLQVAGSSCCSARRTPPHRQHAFL
jgi:hypothetical protein